MAPDVQLVWGELSQVKVVRSAHSSPHQAPCQWASRRAFQSREVQVMWQQQPNEAAQIVSTVIKLTGSLDNRRSLLCRSFAEEGFCSIGLHVAELVGRRSSLRARFKGGMF